MKSGGKTGRAALLLAILLTVLLAAPSLALAQSATSGSIAGQVEGIAGNQFRALVRIRNTSTGVELETLSDARGNFRFAEVEPGTYTIRVNAPGTAPWRAWNVQVAVGRTTIVSPRMTVALFANQRRKHRRYSPDDGLSPSTSDNIGQNLIENLPDSSSRWSALAALAGGAEPDAAGTTALSFRGLSPLMNEIAVDGVNTTLAFRGSERGTRGGGFGLPRSAVSQFQIKAENFSAASGGVAGGVIDAVTRSGGNVLHGQASFYDRDGAWAAQNAFAKMMLPEPIGTPGTSVAPNGESLLYVNGQPVTYMDEPFRVPDRRLEADVGVGGPIRRNKLFWYFSFEDSRRNHPAVARANEPQVFFENPSYQTIETLASRIAGSSNPIYRNCAGVGGPGLVAQAACAYSAVLHQLDGVLGNVPRTAQQMVFFPKIDWLINNRIHITGQVNILRQRVYNGVLRGTSEADGIGSFGDSRTSAESGVARLEYFLTPALVNDLHYQYGRDLFSQAASAATPFEQQFAENSYGRAPQISINRSAGFVLGTLAREDKAAYPLETRQEVDDAVTWIHGLHAFRFGYDYDHVIDAVDGNYGEYGEYSYASLANFVADYLAPDHCDGTTTGTGTYPCYSWFRQTLGSPDWQFSTADYAAFVADDWKILPRFTLSLGVRYDYERLPNPNPAVVNPAIPQTARLPHDRNNFAPRAGVAWQIARHTVLRGGFGLYYGRIPNATVYSALTSTGSARSARSYYYRPMDIGAPPFPYIFAGNETPYINPTEPDAYESQPNAVYFNPHYQNPEIDQATLSLEQQLGRRTTVIAGYIGSFGRELPQFLDTNINLSDAATVYYTLDTLRTPNPKDLGPIHQDFSVPFYYQRINPAYDSITDIVSESNSSYHGAVVRFTRRMERGMDVHITYTYSHAIDDNQDESTFAEMNNVYDPADLGLEHGTSNFDVRQRVRGGVVAHAPWRFRGLMGALLDGYTMAANGGWRTGLPYTMRTIGAIPTPLCSYESWLEAGGPNGGSACLASTVNPVGVPIGNSGQSEAGVPVPGLGRSLNGSGGQDLLPQVGRNTFRYPGTVNLDMRVGKRTSLGEHVSVEFFASVFNVLNHPNATNIQTVGYKITNESASGAASRTNTVNLTYMSGLRTETLPLTNSNTGNTRLEIIPGPNAGFGGVTNFNSNAVYGDRKIQLGAKFYF